MLEKRKLIREFKTRIIPVLPVPQEGSDREGVTKSLRFCNSCAQFLR